MGSISGDKQAAFPVFRGQPSLQNPVGNLQHFNFQLWSFEQIADTRDEFFRCKLPVTHGIVVMEHPFPRVPVPIRAHLDHRAMVEFAFALGIYKVRDQGPICAVSDTHIHTSTD